MEALGHAVQALFGSWAIPGAVLGVLWGILGGALPGISPSIAMALLLPLTYGMDPVTAIVLLASVYVGAEYGGSIPAILIRTPGTNAAAATVIDGYEMNRQGRASEALGISLWSGVVGSLFGLAMLVLLTEPLAQIALVFRYMTYFGLGLLGLSVIVSLSGKSLIRVDINGDQAAKADQWEMEGRIRAVAQGPDGAVYLLEDGGRGSQGRMLRLDPPKP